MKKLNKKKAKAKTKTKTKTRNYIIRQELKKL